MKRRLLILFSIAFPVAALFAQPEKDEPEQVLTFRFVPGQDMFYVPWNGNNTELSRLYALVDEYREEITSGRMPVYVDGYSASMRDTKRNLKLAFIRANRVKSELITHKTLLEEHFVTKNHTVAYCSPDGNLHKDIVVVTLRIPYKTVQPAPKVSDAEIQCAREREEQARREQVARERAERERIAAGQVARETAVQEPPLEETGESPVTYSRWSIGANVGVPFFWGDMNSLASDKTYIGILAGLQATYQLSPMFGITLSLDWAQNKAGSRDYAKGYLLDAEGMTWYTPQLFTTQSYDDLYVKISMFSAGLHCDVNMLRLFGPCMANGRFRVILSPALYAHRFSSKIYTKADDKIFADNDLSKDLSLGLGGNLALRYAVSPTIDLQLKGTGAWITDNLFDNIRTVGYVKQNALWSASAGIVWKIGGNRETNLLYKKK